MSNYYYDIRPTESPLNRNQLYAGRTVCFQGVTTNPNLVGTLVDGDKNGHSAYWKATINNVLYSFDIDGKCLEDSSKVLYGVVTDIDLEFSESSSITRGSGADERTTTLTSLIPKDQFAIAIIESLLNNIPNVLAIDDATIMALAIKAYKIAQAMLYVATAVRGADNQAEQSEDPVPVDEANLTDNVEKILYNLNETLKSIKAQDQNNFNAGLKISTISPTLKVDNPTNDDKFNVEGGGGGGGSINYNSIPSMYSSGNNAIQDIVGFCSDTDNNKILGKITLSNFANAIRDFVYNYIDNRGITDIAVNGAWYQDLVTLIDSRITTKVKESALN